MKDLIINVNTNTRELERNKDFIGVSGENLYGNIIVKFAGEFIDGTAYFEVEVNDEKYFIEMQKSGNTYELPIKSSLLARAGKLPCQVRVESSSTVFKSKKFFIQVYSALDAKETLPDEYADWLTKAEQILDEIEDDMELISEAIEKSSQAMETATEAKETANVAESKANTAIQAVNEKADKSTTINGKTLENNIILTAQDVGALSYLTKYGANLEFSVNPSTFVLTAQLKDQDGNNLGQTQTVDLPLESVVVGGRYDDTTKKVILTLQNGNTVEFSVADLVSGLQSEITTQNPLSSDLVDDTNAQKKLVTTAEKQAWDGKAENIHIDTTASTSVTLTDNTSLRIGTVATLTILGAQSYELDFMCELVFTADTGIALTYASGLATFTGDDTANGEFVPVDGKTYNVLFFNNSNSSTPSIQAVVRGV